MGVVYKATNKINGKAYIGRALDFGNRKLAHLRRSQNENDKSPFYCAIRKYEWDAFEWTILYENDDFDTLADMEYALITEYKTHVPDGYNATYETRGALHFSPEHRAKLSTKAKKRWATHPLLRGNKPVIDADTGKVYDSIREVCKSFHIDSRTVVRICNGGKNPGHPRFNWYEN